MKKEIANLHGSIGENSNLKHLAGQRTLASCLESLKNKTHKFIGLYKPSANDVNKGGDMLNFLIFYFIFCGIIGGVFLVERTGNKLVLSFIIGFLFGWIIVPIKIGSILDDF